MAQGGGGGCVITDAAGVENTVGEPSPGVSKEVESGVVGCKPGRAQAPPGRPALDPQDSQKERRARGRLRQQHEKEPDRKSLCLQAGEPPHTRPTFLGSLRRPNDRKCLKLRGRSQSSLCRGLGACGAVWTLPVGARVPRPARSRAGGRLRPGHGAAERRDGADGHTVKPLPGASSEEAAGAEADSAVGSVLGPALSRRAGASLGRVVVRAWVVPRGSTREASGARAEATCRGASLLWLLGPSQPLLCRCRTRRREHLGEGHGRGRCLPEPSLDVGACGIATGGGR